MIDPALYAKLQTLCLRSFPERLDQRISQVRALDSERRLAWLFTLSWRQGRQPRVERLCLYHHADRWTWWELDDPHKAQREWEVMRWLYAEGLPAPRLYAISDDEAGPALLAAQVTDRATAALWEGEDAAGRSKAEQAARVEQLAALLARLHRLHPPLAVRDVLPQVTVAGQLTRLRDLAGRCQDEGIMQAALELGIEESEERPPCVLCGEPGFASVHHDARGVTALRNWENSALGDPRWDIARTVTWLRSHHTPDLAERFCQAYEERCDLSLVNIAYWETLAAVQQWATGLCALGRQDALQEQVAMWSTHAWRGLTRWRTGR